MISCRTSSDLHYVILTLGIQHGQSGLPVLLDGNSDSRFGSQECFMPTNLPTNLQNFMQKDLTKVKIFLKVFFGGGATFY